MEIFWKGAVSAWFRVIRPKLCGSCAFPQIFHHRKLGEITQLLRNYAIIFRSGRTSSKLSTDTVFFHCKIIICTTFRAHKTQSLKKNFFQIIVCKNMEKLFKLRKSCNHKQNMNGNPLRSYTTIASNNCRI